MNNDFTIFFDGGMKGPPPNARLVVAAVVCTPDFQVVAQQAIEAGNGTNNVAEYRGLMHAICLASLAGAKRPLFYSDSKLVVQQINGFWAMKGDPGSPYHIAHSQCASALMRFDWWRLQHIPREQNKRADWLCSSKLGHGRTTKKPPAVDAITMDGKSRPGWSSLPPSRKAAAA